MTLHRPRGCVLRWDLGVARSARLQLLSQRTTRRTDGSCTEVAQEPLTWVGLRSPRRPVRSSAPRFSTARSLIGVVTPLTSRHQNMIALGDLFLSTAPDGPVGLDDGDIGRSQCEQLFRRGPRLTACSMIQHPADKQEEQQGDG